jgi:hypothetical protein
LENDSKNEQPAIAAAWLKTADPLAGAAYLSMTRRGGSEWGQAVAGTITPTSIAEIYRFRP